MVGVWQNLFFDDCMRATGDRSQTTQSKMVESGPARFLSD